MSGFIGPSYLAAPGSTGNNTHNGVKTAPLADDLAVLFVAEAVGTTVTWKAQGAVEHDQISDANANWFDLPYILPSTDTLSQAAIVRTTTGGDIIWLAQAHIRFFRRIRLVTTANTGITYRAELYQQYRT